MASLPSSKQIATPPPPFFFLAKSSKWRLHHMSGSTAASKKAKEGGILLLELSSAPSNRCLREGETKKAQLYLRTGVRFPITVSWSWWWCYLWKTQFCLTSHSQSVSLNKWYKDNTCIMFISVGRTFERGLVECLWFRVADVVKMSAHPDDCVQGNTVLLVLGRSWPPHHIDL